MKNKFTIIAFLLILFTGFSFSQPYYVSKTGNDGTGDGSPGNPWLTIQHALDVVAAGNTIIVGDGIYTEDLVVSAANITLVSANGFGLTTIQLVDGVGINIQGTANGFTLGGVGKGFTIITGGATTFMIQLENNPSGVTIRYNDIDMSGSASHGISVGAAGATSLTIDHNNFTCADADGAIWASNVSSLDVNNNIFDIDGGGTQASGWAIEIGGGSGSVSRNSITGYGSGIFLLGYLAVVDGYTVTYNDVIDCIKGIRLGHSGVANNVQNLIIGYNYLSDNTTGLYMEENGAGGVFAGTVVINNNSFTGTGTQFNNTTAFTPDATLNWWGNASGPSNAANTFTAPGGAAGQVTLSGNATFVRWLDDGTDTDGGAAGFVPGGAAFAPVTNTTGPVYYSSIQGAINGASAGDIIVAVSGTFTENVTIDERITLQGDGPSNTIISSALANTPVIQISSEGTGVGTRLVVEDLRVTGASGAAGNNTSGITFKAGSGSYTSLLNIQAISNAGNGVATDIGASNTDLVLDQCIMSNNGSNGFNLNSTDTFNGLYITNCTASNNTTGQGLYLEGKITNLTISDGIFKENGDGTWDDTGIYANHLNDGFGGAMGPIDIHDIDVSDQPRGLFLNFVGGAACIIDHITSNNNNSSNAWEIGAVNIYVDMYEAGSPHVTSLTITNVTANNAVNSGIMIKAYAPVDALVIDNANLDGNKTGIYLKDYSANITTCDITNSTIGNNDVGISLVGGIDGVEITNNDILTNTVAGLSIADGMGGSNFAQYNNIVGNTIGIDNNDVDDDYDALYNWWGSVNGPEHSSNTFNVGSQGDIVSDNVTFVRWLDDEFTTGSPFAPFDDGAGNYYSNFADAIAGTAPGGTLTIPEGAFTEDITIDSEITLIGLGAGATFTSITLTTGADLSATSGITAPIVNVNQAGGPPLPSLNDAVLVCSAGGTLNVAAGAYPQDVIINKNIQIVGTGNPTVTSFTLTAGATLAAGSGGITAPVVNINQDVATAGTRLNDAVLLCSSGGIINVTGTTADYAAVTIDKPLTMVGAQGVTIASGSPPITVSATGVTIDGFTFNFVTDDWAIDVLNGPYDVTILNCDFLNMNFHKGVRNQGTGTVTATHNYWGDPSGPTVSSSACGLGCSISGSVLYSPWYADLAHTTLMAAPILVFPANSAVAITVTPNFEWTSITGGVPTYTIEIATDPGFTNVVYGPVATLNGGTDKFYQLPDANALSNGVLYYWRIIETVLAGTSCASGHFITITSAMPYLTNPSNGAILSGLTTTLAWYTGVVGVQYTLQIAPGTDPGFLTPANFLLNTTTTNTYYSVSNTMFTQGGTYYWRVISKTIAATPKIIAYSNTWQFSMPGLPQVIGSYPVGGITIYNNPPTLYWYAQGYNPKVTEYIVRYRRAGSAMLAADYAANSLSNTQGIFSTTNVNWFSTVPFALDGGYQYYWQVAAWDEVSTLTDASYSPEETFFVYGNPTFVTCYPSYPTAGTTVYTATPTLYWYTNVYSPIIYYKIQIADDAAFASIVTTVDDITGSSYTVLSAAGLASGNIYYWRVAASLTSGTAGFGSYSAPASFAVTSTGTAASVATATPASPTSGLVIGVTNPTLSWYVYSADPLQFRVTWATDPAVTGGTFTTAVGTSGWMTSNSFVLGGLTAGATYYWQVQTRLATTQVEGAWSTVAWFTITAGSASVVPLAGSPINGTPINNTSATLSWILPTQSTSVLKYDVQYSKNADFSDAETISNLDKPSVELKNLDKDAVYYWRAASFTNTGKKSDYSAPTSFATGAVVTDVEEQETIPTQFELSQNYPNPFNPTTKISYALPQNSYVSIKVYDMLGREVRSLVSSEMLAGNHSIEWSGENNFGSKVASGTYIYRITAGNYISTKKMVLIK